MKTTTQKGFTLVEIAIVLVIIGLLLGGILKGQEMIVQARTKNVIADFSGVSAAYHGYQDRYRTMPGDDPNAATRWGATVTAAGVQNGVVAGTYNIDCAVALGAPPAESCLFWHHLRLAGFVAGTGWTQPANAVSGKLGVQTGSGTGAAALGGFSGLIICSANLPDKIAISVDNQMDDGAIGTGTVRGQLHGGANPPGPNPNINTAADTTPYGENGTNIYTLCRSL
jgi:prepilin-type N-terminal cleavage/methylation domain-containing protein